ncbi:MAG: aminopeptidase P family protein [Anaerolineales bacterium]|nr:aminopeptidase P family protein [Anaerolineales bacterium]
MKQDLDRLMQERDLDALWITGPANHNPSMVYFTGVANITRADLIKKRGDPPVLFHYPMEREEAARTGLRCRNLGDFRLGEILKEAGGDPSKAGAIRMARIFRELDVSGRVAVGGNVELSGAYALLAKLPSQAPDIRLVGEGGDPILLRARATKSAEEIERVRSIGRVSTAVIAEAAEFLASHSARGSTLVGRDGERLTIGKMKAFIRLRLAERGAEAPEGLIFAQGRDAAIPHSTGTDADPVEAGKTIVFDLFPCEMGGGYFYDVTRTWCPGFATEEAERLYEQVRQAYADAEGKIRAGVPANQVQPAVCDLFESMGHPTIRTDPQTECGYVHTVGHGVGLDVHESPSFLYAESNRDVVEKGAVFTIEPGLYYPEREMGVRLENTVWVRPDGAVEVVAPYPMDLVLPLRKGPKGRAADRIRTPVRRARRAARTASGKRKTGRRPG